MSALQPILATLKRFDTEALFDLRPAYPPVAVEIDRGHLTLVRLAAKRRGRPVLEAFRIQSAPEHAHGATMFRPNLGSLDELTRQLRELFATTFTPL